MNYQNRIYTIFILMLVTLSTVLFTFFSVEDKKNAFNKLSSEIKNQHLIEQKSKIKNSTDNIYAFLKKSKNGKALQKQILTLNNQSFLSETEILLVKNGKVIFSKLKDDINLNKVLTIKDNNGRLFIKQLLENAGENKKQFVFYSWDKPYKTTNENNKIAFSRNFKDITIISTLFIDNTDEMIKKLKEIQDIQIESTIKNNGVFYVSTVLIIIIFSILLYRRTVKQKKNEMDQLLLQVHNAHKIDISNFKLKDEYAPLIEKVNELKILHEQSENELSRLKAKFKDRETKDYLTNMPNKKHFLDIAKGVLAISKREKNPIVIMIVDIKNFKQLIDQYGHDISDDVIKDFSMILKTTIRQSDICSRIFGDRFALLLHNTDKKGAMVLTNRLLDILKEHKIILKEHKISYTINYGITGYDNYEAEEKSLFDKLIKEAENELEKLKKV